TVTVECRKYNRVFVTSATYTGNLGGLAGADAKCQELADAANLGGTYRAWLSVSGTPANSRLTHSTLPYGLVDGTLIANDWDHLVSNAMDLAAPITMTETGETKTTDPFSCAWTGSYDGGFAFGQDCNKWTSEAANETGTAG